MNTVGRPRGRQPKEMEKDGKILVNSAIACEKLLCNHRELANWRKLGMPAIKIGQSWYYDLEKCHAWFRGEKEKSA
jgi:hypothetical protein